MERLSGKPEVEAKVHVSLPPMRIGLAGLSLYRRRVVTRQPAFGYVGMHLPREAGEVAAKETASVQLVGQVFDRVLDQRVGAPLVEAVGDDLPCGGSCPVGG